MTKEENQNSIFLFCNCFILSFLNPTKPFLSYIEAFFLVPVWIFYMGDLSLGMYWNIQILFGTWKVARMFGKLQICAKVINSPNTAWRSP